jgi:lysophospholipase L1-like esterase
VKRLRRDRLISLCVALPLLTAGLWFARRPLHHLYLREKARFLGFVSASLIDTRFSNSAWAHSLLSGYADLDRYQAANRVLPHTVPGRVVFYGDSVTEQWANLHPAQFFPGKPYLGRGISGQSTGEMYWRFQQDVIDLHPSTVVLLGGTNDVVLTNRYIPFQQTTRNIQAMVQAGDQHGIRVILGSILPVARCPQPDEATFTARIRALNAWLRSYAAQHHLTFIDYFSAMSTPTGALNPTLSDDGLHPNAHGYAIMQPLAQQALNSPPP